jgi:hypothetical protein
MQATILADKAETSRLEDEYLGFGIRLVDGLYVAAPMGWTGEVIVADTMPTLRRKIWRWWHMVQ